MVKKADKYKLLMEELDTGYLMILIGGEQVNVRPEDCLGLLNAPMFHGENASFDLTQEQFETIRRRTLARQNKVAASVASEPAQAEQHTQLRRAGQPTPHSELGELLRNTAAVVIPVVIGALTVYLYCLIRSIR